MKTVLKSMALVTLFAIMTSGCVSYSAVQHTKEKIALRKAISTNNEKAIKSLNNGNGYKNSGVEVTTWEAVKEEPLLHTGAVIADGIIIWGGAEGVKWMSDELQDESPSNNRNTTIAVSDSDGTTINISGDTTTDTDTTTTSTDNSNNSDNSQ